MKHWAGSAVVCVAAVAVLFPAGRATGARQAPTAIEGKTVFLTAESLAQASKTGLSVVSAGTWHAWAWQRGGVAVTWTIAGRRLGPVKAAGDSRTFAWVKLGKVDLAAGKAIKVAFTPGSAKATDAAVAALALARADDFHPAGLWRLSRVHPDSAAPCGDARPGKCRHLNQRYTMPKYKTREAWAKRADWLRRHIRVSSGLVPEPPRTDLKPRIFGKIERDGYTIEKAFIESRPGFYVCGNLYRPRGGKGPFPGVATPHGHWAKGRFGHQPPRGSVPARCITLARLGYVVFAYDMVGYNDSGKQVGKHRGVFSSPHNELWGLSMMHLQSWNTIRAIDFLQSLKDVDPKRIGLTGCSGGGTQTFMVMGIEPRVTVAAPACMISGIMQGGCECENAPLLRIETNNIEIGALMAPRPMVIPSATGDWTKETPKAEYPSIRGAYELYGAADRVANVHVTSPHGYNITHREGVYTFFDRWLQHPHRARTKPGAAKITEPKYTLEKHEDLLVWQGRQLPKDARTPKTLKADVIAQCRRQLAELLPGKAADRKRFDETLGEVYRHAIMASAPKADELAVEELGKTTVGRTRVTRLLLGRKGAGDRVPALLYSAGGTSGKAPACVVVCPGGKADLIDADTGTEGPLLAALLTAGWRVLAVDVYLTGEFHSPFARTQQKKSGRYFATYNRTEIVQRVQDILTATAYLARRGDVKGLALVGVGQAGAWCLLAAPMTPEGTRVAVDLAQLTGDEDPRWLGDLFTPLILKAGGPWTAAALAAPRPMLLHNIATSFDIKPCRAAYRAAGKSDRIRIEPGLQSPDAVVRWLTP